MRVGEGDAAAEGEIVGVAVGDEPWSDDELRASARAYREMADEERAGRSYSKAAIRDRLLAGPLGSRSVGSFEYRMANISAVLDEEGAQWLNGYKPARNVGANVRARLIPILRAEGLL